MSETPTSDHHSCDFGIFSVIVVKRGAASDVGKGSPMRRLLLAGSLRVGCRLQRLYQSRRGLSWPPELLPADTAITAPSMLRGAGVDDGGLANTSAAVTWTSLTPGIVTVDETGLVTPVVHGNRTRSDRGGGIHRGGHRPRRGGP